MGTWDCASDYPCSCPASTSVTCAFFDAIFTDPCLIACDDQTICCQAVGGTPRELCVAQHDECYDNCTSVSEKQLRAHMEMWLIRNATKEMTAAAVAPAAMWQRRNTMKVVV